MSAAGFIHNLDWNITFLISYTILNAWLRYHTVIPDTMGYVSSMTIENPYISIPGIIPGAGSTLSGMERTKLLRSMRVRIGDLHPGQEFGKLVLAKVDLWQRLRGKECSFEIAPDDCTVRDEWFIKRSLELRAKMIMIKMSEVQEEQVEQRLFMPALRS